MYEHLYVLLTDLRLKFVIMADASHESTKNSQGGLRLRLHWTDPIQTRIKTSFQYRLYYHLVLLLVWLIRYLDYLIISAKLPKTQSESHRNAAALVHDVLLGVFVVFFVPAWMYRAINHRVRKEWAFYLTLFVELLLEIALVVYYVLYLYFYKERRTFAQLVWYAVWLLHLSLIIYNLLPVFICFSFINAPGRRAALYASITGGTTHATDNFSLRSRQDSEAKANASSCPGIDQPDATHVTQAASSPEDRTLPAFVPKIVSPVRVASCRAAVEIVDTPFGPVEILANTTSVTLASPDKRSNPTFVLESADPAEHSPGGSAERVVDTPFGPIVVPSDSSS